MENNLFQGQLVRLTAENPDTMAGYFSRSSRDSEFLRLTGSYISQMPSQKKIQEWIEKDLAKVSQPNIIFTIRTLSEDRIIGDIGLDGIKWNHGEAFVGIGIGERDFWGKGYGTDAMRIVLRYAFTEVNLHRVSLDVFEYNPRAIRSYEKAGFKIEGRVRKYLLRDGKRWDLIFMGILKDEWGARVDVH